MNLFLKNKKVTFEKRESEYFLNEKKINVKTILLLEATLTTEFAYLIVISDKPYFLRSQSWLKNQTDKEDDRNIVETLNSSFSTFEPTVLKDPIFGVVPSKLDRPGIFP